MQTIETEKLRLRPLEKTDVEELYELLYADGDDADNLTNRTLDELTEQSHPDVPWGDREELSGHTVVRKDDGAMLGWAGFQPLTEEDRRRLPLPEGTPQVATDLEHPDVELVCALGERYRWRGYEAEVGRALIAHGFEELGVGRIINTIGRDDSGARDVMTQLNFEQFGPPELEYLTFVLPNPHRGVSRR